MIWFYRILFFPVMLVASPYYIRRMLRRGGYGENFGQRFGAVPPLPGKRVGARRIWLQAVSVGEVLAVGPLLERLAAMPDVEIYLSTTTSTGYKLARERYAARCIGIAYFPIDGWPFSVRAWRRIQPDLILLTEGERWPEHISQAEARGIPVVCINARMSDRGYRRMMRARQLVCGLFRGITLWLPGSEQDAERLRAIGFPAGRIRATGNLKLDVTIVPLSGEEKAGLRRELGLADVPTLLGSSTWPGEEEAVVRAWQACRSEGAGPVALILVPRHAERRGEVEAALDALGLASHFRSRGPAPAPVDVAVGDTTGELRKLTQLADLVFVGKSLPPHHEGQTPVEAAALGKPILFGPEMSNFREIARDLERRGAARVVRTPEELASAAKELMADPSKRAAMAAAAQTWQRDNQGALERTLAELRRELDAVRRA